MARVRWMKQIILDWIKMLNHIDNRKSVDWQTHRWQQIQNHISVNSDDVQKRLPYAGCMALCSLICKRIRFTKRPKTFVLLFFSASFVSVFVSFHSAYVFAHSTHWKKNNNQIRPWKSKNNGHNPIVLNFIFQITMKLKSRTPMTLFIELRRKSVCCTKYDISVIVQTMFMHHKISHSLEIAIARLKTKLGTTNR